MLDVLGYVVFGGKLKGLHFVCSSCMVACVGKLLLIVCRGNIENGASRRVWHDRAIEGARIVEDQ